MNNKTNMQTAAKRTERTHYTGVYNDFKTMGTTISIRSSIHPIEKEYSEYQDFLYKRIVLGLSMYTPEEVSNMHWQKRNRIVKVQKRAWKEINLWKQSRIIEITNKIFSLFHHSPVANQLISDFSESDSNFDCKLSFKELKVNKDTVIDLLLAKGLLPANFHRLGDNLNASN